MYINYLIHAGIIGIQTYIEQLSLAWDDCYYCLLWINVRETAEAI